MTTEAKRETGHTPVCHYCARRVDDFDRHAELVKTLHEFWHEHDRTWDSVHEWASVIEARLSFAGLNPEAIRELVEAAEEMFQTLEEMFQLFERHPEVLPDAAMWRDWTNSYDNGGTALQKIRNDG